VAHALAALTDRNRLLAVARLLPLDPGSARVLDRLVHLAAGLVDAPIAMITIIDGHQQVFAAQSGLPDVLAAAGSTPIEYSICQYAVARGRPLIVGDARLDPLLYDNLAVVELGAVAYAGIPLVIAGGHVVGSLCAVDLVPREWSDDQLAQLALLADSVAAQLDRQPCEWGATVPAGRWGRS
jgi:GAF domain-containing protein